MIQIIQAGQAGKTKYLLDMYRLRARIFKERMGWNVNVDMHGLETDDFDIQEAVYLLALNDNQQAVGSWRILPTNGPTMIHQVWPSFLEEMSMRSSSKCWEMSRFGVHTNTRTSVKEGLRSLNDITGKMFCALTELSILCGIEEIYTLYDHRIERILKRLNCHPEKRTSGKEIDGITTYVGMFIPDKKMLQKIREATNISYPLITEHDLPLSLKETKTKPLKPTIIRSKYEHDKEACLHSK